MRGGTEGCKFEDRVRTAENGRINIVQPKCKVDSQRSLRSHTTLTYENLYVCT